MCDHGFNYGGFDLRNTVGRRKHSNAGVARHGHDIEHHESQFRWIKQLDLEGPHWGRTVHNVDAVHVVKLLDGAGIGGKQ